MTATVYFVGAGPGDIQLLTLKARDIIERADVIIYADSLINPAVLTFARPVAEVHGSAALTLEETTDIIVKAVREGKTVARLQSGDPSIYGAIREQMAALEGHGIACEVVPGVSSLFAAAAALRSELTVPGVTQTVIVTRAQGRTAVPERESLRNLATHGATLAIFLSISLLDKVVADLLRGGLDTSTPAAVVFRASWHDERVVRTTLGALEQEVKKAGITRQALILVGRFLDQGTAPQSRLYDGGFSHGYR